MLTINTERIGDMAIVECDGRIVRSDAAVRLRAAVTSQEGAEIVVLDFSEVSTVEGGGLGMLRFLQRWAHDSRVQLKIFNPSSSVYYRLQQASPVDKFEIPSLPEMMALLAQAEDQQKARAQDATPLAA
ncbi:MAG TPA: STAS domain-containing protein [Terriglobales bacterium]|jgi:anti-anti-sigma regulatory factor